MDTQTTQKHSTSSNGVTAVKIQKVQISKEDDNNIIPVSALLSLGYIQLDTMMTYNSFELKQHLKTYNAIHTCESSTPTSIM